MYSIDFKKQAVKYKENGHTFKELNEAFNISAQTYYDWKKKFEQGFYQREHARALRGIKVEDTKRGRKFERINVIGSTVIMDNASFHRKKILNEIAEKFNIKMLFLPPYSPDFNPIEKSWGNLKRNLCDSLKSFQTISDATK